MGVSSSLLLQTKALKVRMLQHSQNLEKVVYSFFLCFCISKLPHTIESECSTSMRGSEIEKKMCANELGRHLVLVSTNSDKIFHFEETEVDELTRTSGLGQ